MCSRGTSGSLVAGAHRRRNRWDGTPGRASVKRRFYGTAYGVGRRANALECALIRASAHGSVCAAGTYSPGMHVATAGRKTDRSWCVARRAPTPRDTSAQRLREAASDACAHARTCASKSMYRAYACARALSRHVPQNVYLGDDVTRGTHRAYARGRVETNRVPKWKITLGNTTAAGVDTKDDGRASCASRATMLRTLSKTIRRRCTKVEKRQRWHSRAKRCGNGPSRWRRTKDKVGIRGAGALLNPPTQAHDIGNDIKLRRARR